MTRSEWHYEYQEYILCNTDKRDVSRVTIGRLVRDNASRRDNHLWSPMHTLSEIQVTV